jgi:L-cysteine/cystine lyase
MPTLEARSRRSFIRTFGGGILGGAMLYAFPGDARAKYIISHDQHIPAGDEYFWDLVRSQFPLREEPLYLNNGTMGPSPYVVIDATVREMQEIDRSGRYGGWEDLKPKIARFINANEKEIALTHNVTEGINIVACGLPLRKGDEVVMTDHEHAGNAMPWLARARRDGISVVTFTPALTAAETLDRLSSRLGPRTRAIAVPHITCTTGHVLPAREICRLGREKGIPVLIDAAHTPGMLPLDVREMECDFLATCGHKWMLGPKGTGFLYIREEMLDLLEPYWTGGGAETGWDLKGGSLEFKGDAGKFDFASQNAAIAVGLGAAVDFLFHIGMENVTRRGRSLAARLRAGLEGLDGKTDILTPSEEGGYGSILSFRRPSVPYDRLYRRLREEYGIVTRMVPENGVDCNRISTHIYNSPSDVDRLVEAIAAIG